MANTGNYEVSMTKMEMVCFGPHRIYPYCVGIGCILDSRTSTDKWDSSMFHYVSCYFEPLACKQFYLVFVFSMWLLTNSGLVLVQLCRSGSRYN